MALLAAKGSFSAQVATGNHSYTGLGFQPKAVIFWLTRQTAVGFAANRALGLGFAADASQQGVQAQFSSDAVTVDTEMGIDTRSGFCLEAITATGGLVTVDLQADYVGSLSDGFELHYGITGAGLGFLVHFLALGGSDITDVWAGVFNTPTVTGTQDVTTPGFQPDFYMLLTPGTGTLPRADASVRMSLGLATAADQVIVCSQERASIPTDIRSLETTGQVIHTFNSSGVDTLVAAHSAMLSNGFRLNHTVVQATARGVLGLALKGGQYKVFTDTQKTSTGTKAKTGIGFQPTGLFLAGTNKPNSASVDATNAALTIGGTDGSIEGCAWVGAADNVSTTDENSNTSTTKVLVHATGPSTVDAEADTQTLDSDGYTFNWTTADAVAREFGGAAFGSAAVAPGGGKTMLLLGTG